MFNTETSDERFKQKHSLFWVASVEQKIGIAENLIRHESVLSNENAR